MANEFDLDELEAELSDLQPMDYQGLLNVIEVREQQGDYSMTDDELLAELAGDDDGADIQNLRHVRSNAEKREAEEIAQRDRCEDF